jgi:hypothetical protein
MRKQVPLQKSESQRALDQQNYLMRRGNPLAGLTKEDHEAVQKAMDEKAQANASPIPVVWPASD